MIVRWTRFVVAHRRSVLAAWLVLVVLGGYGTANVGKLLTNRLVIQKLGNRGKGSEVNLELILRDHEKHDESDRGVVQRIEFNAGRRSSKRCHHFANAIRGRMWNGNAKPDSGAHGLFALSQGGKNRIPVRGPHAAFDHFGRCGLGFLRLDLPSDFKRHNCVFLSSAFRACW